MSQIKVTNVTISRDSGNRKKRLLAMAAITINRAIVIRGIRIVQGEDGLIVAMPSRPLVYPCHCCRAKVSQLARYCEKCGAEFCDRPTGSFVDSLHSDVVHPANYAARSAINVAVIVAYERFLEDIKAHALSVMGDDYDEGVAP